MFEDDEKEEIDQLGHEIIEDSHQADHEIVCIDVTA